MPIVAPKYVSTAWNIGDFDPYPDGPLIPPQPNAFYIEDQPTLDAVLVAAALVPLTLLTSDTPPPELPAPLPVDPFLRYDRPQPLLSTIEQALMQQNLGLPPTGTPDGQFPITATGVLTWRDAAGLRDLAGTALIHTPEQFADPGHVFNVTDDTVPAQAAVDALAASGGGMLALTGPGYKFGGLILKSGVHITCLTPGQKLGGGATHVLITPPAAYTGWLIDSPGTAIKGAGVSGVLIAGGVSSGASPNTGGVRIQHGVWCMVDAVSVSGTSLGSVYVNGTACTLQNCIGQNFWQWRVLTAAEGAVFIGGTDHYVANNQCNGGIPLGDAVDTAHYYKCGMLAATYTSIFIGGNGEYAEVGCKVGGFANQYFGLRGDTNNGRGIWVANTTNFGGITRNTFRNTLVLGNSLAADGESDGLYVDCYGNDFDGISIAPNFVLSANRHRYGVKDDVSVAGWTPDFYRRYGNRYRAIRSDAGANALDQFDVTNFQGYAVEEGGAGFPTVRPPARWCAGKTWFDTNRSLATVSDGTKWRGVGGDVLSNLFPPDIATARTGLHWNVTAGTSTVAWIDCTAAFQQNKGVEVTTTAGGVAATYAGSVQSTAAPYLAAVKAGHVYQTCVHALAKVANTGTAPKVLVCVAWYDVAFALIGAIVVQAAVNLGTVDTEVVNPAITAPAGALWASVDLRFQATTLTTGDKFQFTKVGLVEGSALLGYVEP